MNDDAYEQQFAKVLDYIERHLGEELSVERLSREANFSKFHFHRQFSAYVGVNVSRYVQMLRLQRASRRLVFEPAAKIIDVAFEAGFETPEILLSRLQARIRPDAFSIQERPRLEALAQNLSVSTLQKDQKYGREDRRFR